MKVKVLTGKEFDAYNANLSKIENMQAMETQLSEAATTITELTTALQEQAAANTDLQTEVTNLESQVTALQAGSGNKPLKVKAKSEGSSGDKMADAITIANSLLVGMGKR